MVTVEELQTKFNSLVPTGVTYTLDELQQAGLNPHLSFSSFFNWIVASLGKQTDESKFGFVMLIDCTLILCCQSCCIDSCVTYY